MFKKETKEAPKVETKVEQVQEEVSSGEQVEAFLWPKEEVKATVQVSNADKELIEVLAKALQDAQELLPPGGSIRNTVTKALKKYNESK